MVFLVFDRWFHCSFSRNVPLLLAFLSLRYLFPSGLFQTALITALACFVMAYLFSQFLEACEPAGIQTAVFNSCSHGAPRLVIMLAVVEPASPPQCLDVLKAFEQVTLFSPHRYLPHAGVVDDDSASWHEDKLASNGGVPAGMVALPDIPRFLPFFAEKRIDLG